MTALLLIWVPPLPQPRKASKAFHSSGCEDPFQVIRDKVIRFKVIEEKYGTGYAIKSAAGKYIYQSGENNGIKTSNALSDAVVLNITLEDGKTVISPTDGKTKFVYNKSSKMFRFYKNATISGNTGGYPIVNLFKASE